MRACAGMLWQETSRQCSLCTVDCEMEMNMQRKVVRWALPRPVLQLLCVCTRVQSSSAPLAAVLAGCLFCVCRLLSHGRFLHAFKALYKCVSVGPAVWSAQVPRQYRNMQAWSGVNAIRDLGATQAQKQGIMHLTGQLDCSVSSVCLVARCRAAVQRVCWEAGLTLSDCAHEASIHGSFRRGDALLARLCVSD